MEEATRMSEEMRALYKEKGVKTSSAFLPLLSNTSFDGLVPSPSQVEFLKVGHSLVGYEYNR